MRGHDVGLDYHRGMLADLTRMDAYARAIAQVVRPGDVVLDVGAGTGILSMLAARAGAARVHAVESMPVAELARELVAANGLSGVVRVHRADLVELSPIEPVDRVIGEWMGRFLVDDRMEDAVEAAVRWLKPGGTIHPERIALRVAPVGDFEVPMLEGFERTLHGLDFRPARARALHTCYRAHLSPAQLLGPSAHLATWVCREAFPAIEATLRLEIARAGRLKGLAGWFVADLAPGVQLSSGPERDTHWGQYLFPLEPREVAPGEVLELHLAWDGAHWSWGDQRSDWTAASGAVDPTPIGDPVALSNLGTEAFHRGDLAAAEAAYSDATRSLAGSPPESAPLWENLGLARMNLGAHADAARAFLEALAHGDRPQALRFVVLCLQRAGRPRDAEAMLARYRAAYGPHPDVD